MQRPCVPRCGGFAQGKCGKRARETAPEKAWGIHSTRQTAGERRRATLQAECRDAARLETRVLPPDHRRAAGSPRCSPAEPRVSRFFSPYLSPPPQRWLNLNLHSRILLPALAADAHEPTVQAIPESVLHILRAA